MRYFTQEWWSEGCADTAPIDAYRAHFSSIRASLPPAVVAFEEHHTLHDSRIESVVVDLSERSVLLNLAGWDRTFSRPVHYRAHFTDVERFEQHLPKGRDLESELGDIGYWEYELRPPRVELRMLFASGAEFLVTFGDARFTPQSLLSAHSSAG